MEKKIPIIIGNSSALLPVTPSTDGLVKNTLEVVYKALIRTKYPSKNRKYLKGIVRDEVYKLYDKVKSNSGTEFFRIPTGVLKILPESFFDRFEVRDSRTNEITIPFKEYDDLKIAEILMPEFPYRLRTDQVEAVKRGLVNRSGIVQLPTGAGKSYVMMAIIKILITHNPECKVLVLEPTNVLVDGTLDKLRSLGMDAESYKTIRYNEDCDSMIHVTHPASIKNDIINKEIKHTYKVVMIDECHHGRSGTIIDNIMKSYGNEIEYKIGFSASALPDNPLLYKENPNFVGFEIDDMKLICSIGIPLISIPSSYYMERGLLTTPVLIRINNFLDLPSEYSDFDKTTWSKLSTVAFKDPSRLKSVETVVGSVVPLGYHVLLLSSTVQTSNDVSDYLASVLGLDILSRVGIVQGGGVNKLFSTVEGKFVDTDQDVIDMYQDGRLSVIFGTTNMDEGVDLKNLDVVVLLTGGSSNLKLLQRVGRVMRSSKTGKHGYIVDFFDNNNSLLSRQSDKRYSNYVNLLSIPTSHIFNILPQDFLAQFRELEGLGNN